MITTSISVDSAAAQNALDDLVQRQLPFALSKGINQITLNARREIQAHTEQAFTIRRRWVLNGWRVKLSNKRDTPIAGSLWLDPTRDFLAKFEPGGIKTSRSGASLAVPIEARRTPTSIVPDRLRIRALNLRAHHTKRGAIQLKGEQRTFVVRTGARTLILQRKGKHRVDTLYVFKRSVPIPSSLQFFTTVQSYVDRLWPSVVGDALANAVRTAR